jgi:uncharacterized lipoprotein YmbA
LHKTRRERWATNLEREMRIRLLHKTRRERWATNLEREMKAKLLYKGTKRV